MKKEVICFLVFLVVLFMSGCESTVSLDECKEREFMSYEKGYQSGYTLGEEEGYSFGYSDGYSDGYEDAEREVWHFATDCVYDWLPYEDYFYDFLDQCVDVGHIKSYRK